MLPPGTLVNAIRSALAFVILLECFASFLSLATPDEMPKADKFALDLARPSFLEAARPSKKKEEAFVASPMEYLLGGIPDSLL